MTRPTARLSDANAQVLKVAYIYRIPRQRLLPLPPGMDVLIGERIYFACTNQGIVISSKPMIWRDGRYRSARVRLVQHPSRPRRWLQMQPIATNTRSPPQGLCCCCARELFHARAHQAIERARKDGSGMSPEDLLQRMDKRLTAARELLAQARHRDDASTRFAARRT